MRSQQEKRMQVCLTVIVLCQLMCLMISPVKCQFFSLSRLRGGTSKAKQLLLKEIMNLEVTRKMPDSETAAESRELLEAGKAAGQPEMPLSRLLAMSLNEEVRAKPEHANKVGCEFKANQQNGSCWPKGSRAGLKLGRSFGFVNLNRPNSEYINNLLDSNSRLNRIDGQNGTESAPELLKMLLNLELLIDSLKEQRRS